MTPQRFAVPRDAWPPRGPDCCALDPGLNASLADFTVLGPY